jgi:hypothetical protein
VHDDEPVAKQASSKTLILLLAREASIKQNTHISIKQNTHIKHQAKHSYCFSQASIKQNTHIASRSRAKLTCWTSENVAALQASAPMANDL